MVLWRWGRLLFKQEDMKEEGVFFVRRENGEGCCDENQKAVVMNLRRLLW